MGLLSWIHFDSLTCKNRSLDDESFDNCCKCEKEKVTMLTTVRLCECKLLAAKREGDG